MYKHYYKLFKLKLQIITVGHPVIADLLQMAAGLAVRNLLAGLPASGR